MLGRRALDLTDESAKLTFSLHSSFCMARDEENRWKHRRHDFAPFHPRSTQQIFYHSFYIWCSDVFEQSLRSDLRRKKPESLYDRGKCFWFGSPRHILFVNEKENKRHDSGGEGRRAAGLEIGNSILMIYAKAWRKLQCFRLVARKNMAAMLLASLVRFSVCEMWEVAGVGGEVKNV